ncbi:alpha/beta fold hydrolase [Streptomyces toxytricini]|uniref:alpha/beta fold hydrolase n=1 Tax=Streptomyces toxytricini TaxID=67369 RepID=UPI00343FC9C0
MDGMLPVQDGEVWAEDSGGAGRGGLPLVLLHPGVGDSAVWDPVLPLLFSGYRVEGIVRLGLRIWGRAGGGTPESDPVAAAQLRGALPAWFAAAGRLREDAPAFDRLAEVRAPALLALGELDQAEVVRCNEEMAARIPGCRLVRLAGCDHYPSLRAPEAVAGLVDEAHAEAASAS